MLLSLATSTLRLHHQSTSIDVFEWRRKRRVFHLSYYWKPPDNFQIKKRFWQRLIKYLGHIIFSDRKDNDDIQREVRNMFMRTNLLIRRFSKCSFAVKLVLFKAYCICLYDACLWSNYKTGCLSKLKLCYHKCIKMFFGFKRCDSVTQILFNLGLPSFDTLLHNSRVIFFYAWCKCPNMLVFHMQQVVPCKGFYCRCILASF